jgi:hypothetical protein
MLLSFHLILGVLRVVREPCLPPRVVDRLHTDFVLRVNDPLGDSVACGSRDWDIGILGHHPIEEFVMHIVFEGLVIAGINRLDKPHAAGGDELNLHAEGLDGIDNRPHLVDPKPVQEEDGDCCNPWGPICQEVPITIYWDDLLSTCLPKHSLQPNTWLVLLTQ